MKKKRTPLSSSPKDPSKDIWYLYILLCKNGSLYTGISNNIEKRFLAHQKGKGSWYTRVFGAEKILYTEICGTKSQAFKREHAIKRLPCKKKWKLLKGEPS